LASELLNKPNLPREADRLIFTVQQLANIIAEFKKRYHCRLLPVLTFTTTRIIRPDTSAST
jgi:hypothetical protein